MQFTASARKGDEIEGRAEQALSRCAPRQLKIEVYLMPYLPDTALSALSAAWTTTMLASTLFATALAFSPVWDTAVYLKGLQRALNLDM
jgi:hypothetical protein